MEKRLTLRNCTSILIIPALLLVSIFAISELAVFQTETSALSIGITLDLLITIPLVYLLLIRKKNIPLITGVPVFILGILLATYLIPTENQGLLEILKFTLLPVIELTAMTFLLLKVRKLIQRTRELTANQLDFFDAIHLSMAGLIPKKIIPLFATEVSTIYYAFIAWKKPKLEANQFSYHEKSGSVTLFFAILLIIIPEAITVHILLAKWSIAMAWIFTILTIYSAIQVLGFGRSLNKRPIEINAVTLSLRYGMMKTADIPLDKISAVEGIAGDLTEKIYRLSFLKELESPNVIIRLKEPQMISGLYGSRKHVSAIALHIDERSQFIQVIDKSIEHNHSL